MVKTHLHLLHFDHLKKQKSKYNLTEVNLAINLYFMYSYILSIVLMIQNKFCLFQNSRPDHHILLNKLMLSIPLSEN